MPRKSFSARTLGANALKSFAHPLRLRLFELLDEHGPSTATRLAALLGQNTGATSYHLRELARHGIIEVVPGMGRGKEKFWRVTPGGFSYGDPAEDPEAASALTYLLDDLVRQRGAELNRWRSEEERTREEWVRASVLARRSLRLTVEEASGLRDEVLAVLERYRGLSDGRAQAAQAEPAAPPPGTGHVVVHFDLFPVGETHQEETP